MNEPNSRRGYFVTNYEVGGLLPEKPLGPMGRTRMYRAWASMRFRCRSSSSEAWKYYGGRGIKVCKRWENFYNFLKDMGAPPPNLSLDRINNDGDYEPSNCRWATRSEQSKNRRKPQKRRARQDSVGEG